MFQILHDTKIDFLGKTKIWLSISAALVLASIVVLATHGLNKGIEFTGGTEIQVKYRDAVSIADVRGELQRAGYAGAEVTSLGDPETHEVYIRIPLAEDEASSRDVAKQVVDALRDSETAKLKESGKVNVNVDDPLILAGVLGTAPGATPEEATSVAEAIAQVRKEKAIFGSVDELSAVPGMTPTYLDVLKARAFAGPMAVRGQSYIGPLIGKEIVEKAFFAILGSLGGMLVYIWIRFQFQWGLAAVLALAHDTIITLGLFSVLDLEMSLPVVASFLTLIGYSVNDTVVVFDRVRENIKLRGGEKPDLRSLINDSINQTLSRTILTSSLTWVCCLSLLVFGGPVLRGFSTVLVAGIVVGTYSSIWVASPILVVWREWIAKRSEAKAPASGRPAAKKVRSSSKA